MRLAPGPRDGGREAPAGFGAEPRGVLWQEPGRRAMVRAMTKSDPESRWFGYRPVEPEQKTALVRGVFASVASRYDVMNDLMSGGVHRLWKARFIEEVRPRPGERLLDVAGGTGDIALRFLARGG